MSEDTITYEFIREISREEQNSPTLSKLPLNFVQKVMEYLKQKEKLLGTQKDKQVSQEIENTKRLLETIFNRRETKILNHAIITSRTDIPPENLTKEEQDLFENIVEQLKQRKQKVLNILNKKSKEKKPIKESSDKIEFTEDIEEFVGVDLKKYGPFKKGQKAKIPEENAELFKKAGKAR